MGAYYAVTIFITNVIPAAKTAYSFLTGVYSSEHLSRCQTARSESASCRQSSNGSSYLWLGLGLNNL